MKFYLLLLSLFIVGCINQTAEIERLSAENQALSEQVQSLERQLSGEGPREVAIANTTQLELTSSSNGQTYQLKISYPKGYQQDSLQRYPVLYVTDAETNFGGISYIVQRLIKDKLIPNILVVGIAYGTDYDNFYRLRSRDLTPVEDQELRMGGRTDPTGGAPLFCDFMEQELFPFIEQQFRVQANDRAIYGHSYGGLFGSYVLMERPDLFNRYLILSPSLWYMDQLLVQQVENRALNFSNEKRVYMGSGEFEGRIDDLQLEFAAALSAKELPQLHLKSEIHPNETHRTIFGVGFTNGLRHVYGE